MEFSRVESRTSRAAEGSSPARQIRSVNASIFSSLEVNEQVVDDAFAGIDAAYEFRKPGVVYFQAVTDDGPRLGASIDLSLMID